MVEADEKELTEPVGYPGTTGVELLSMADETDVAEETEEDPTG